MCGQFSAVLGNNSLLQHLQELGIDTLTDHLNMQVSDTNFRHALDTILNRLSNLITNIEQSWVDTYPRRLENYHYVRSNTFVNKLECNLKKWLI